MRNNSKGQAWSIDLVIGTLVFATVILVFYSVISGPSDDKVKDYSSEADRIMQKFMDEGLIDPVTGELNDQVYLELSQKDYQALKQEFGVGTGEFCMVIETVDDPPTYFFIHNRSGIGSPTLELADNISCGEIIS